MCIYVRTTCLLHVWYIVINSGNALISNPQLKGGEPTKGQAAGALRTLALNSFNRLYINKEKGVNALCAALYEKSIRLQTQVVGALWNLTHEMRCVQARTVCPLSDLVWLSLMRRALCCVCLYR